MGRNEKEHYRLNLRFDGYIYERMEKYLEEVNRNKTKKKTVTAFIEESVEAYLNYLEDDLEIDRM